MKPRLYVLFVFDLDRECKNNQVIEEMCSIGCHLFFCKHNILLFVQPRWQPRTVFPVSVIKYFGEGAMSYIGSPRASHARFHTSLNCSSSQYIHRDAEKRNHFSFMIKSFNTKCNLTKFSTLIVNEYYRRCYLFNFWNLH